MRRPSSRRNDAVLAALVAALTQAELWLGDDVGGASRAALAVVLLIATAGLAWRRRAPMACAVLIGVGLAAQGAIAGTDLQSLGWTVAALVALYSAGRFLDLRPALVALGAVVAGLAIRELRDVESYRQDGYQNAFWWLLVAVPFGAGVYLRSREQASALRGAAARSEAGAVESARAAVAQERAGIARELHDVVAHDMSAVVLQAEAAEALLDEHPARTRESLHTI